MPISNLTLCYEGIQRVYRNTLVRHLRTKFNTAFPSDSAEKLQKPFTKEEWADIKDNANLRRSTGEISSELTDDFDLLSVNHFFNLFDSYYADLCPAHPDAKTQRTQKQALLQWIKTVKSLRDPLSHPSEQDFGFEDSFFLLSCAKRVLHKLECPAEAKLLEDLMHSLSGRPLSISSEIEPLEDRLPARESIVVDFVGRATELKILWEWFEDPVSRRWALAGEGGKGKSAVAYNFATEVMLKAPKPYQMVIWLSAKKKLFQEGSTRGILKPDFVNLETALNKLLTDFGWLEEIGHPVETKASRTLELLNNFPSLVIVDDIDSLEGEDEAAIEFFTFDAARTRSKLLFTSRRIVFGMANITTHISGLPHDDAVHFIRSRQKLMGLDPSSISDRQLEEIVTVTEGSPLFMEDLVRLTRVIATSEAVKYWKSKSGHEARRYALGRELELLSHKARHVLIAACINDLAVSFPELEAITGTTKEELTGALNELQRLFLIPKPRLIEGEQRFDINLNTRTLVRKALLETEPDLYRRTETAVKSVKGEVGKSYNLDISAIITQAVFLVKNKEYGRAEELLNNALSKYHEHPDLVGVLGWIYKSSTPIRIADARSQFKRAAQLKSRKEEMFRHWIRMELDRQEWTQAADAAETGLKNIPSSNALRYFAGLARSRLARELLAGLHTERAGKELALSQTHLRNALREPENLDFGERQLNADVYRSLVLNCELLRRTDLMLTYFSSWLKEHPDDINAHTEWERLSKGLHLGAKPA